MSTPRNHEIAQRLGIPVGEECCSPVGFSGGKWVCGCGLVSATAPGFHTTSRTDFDSEPQAMRNLVDALRANPGWHVEIQAANRGFSCVITADDNVDGSTTTIGESGYCNTMEEAVADAALQVLPRLRSRTAGSA